MPTASVPVDRSCSSTKAYTQGARHFQHRVEAWLGAGCEGFVQALAPETGIPGNLRHAAGTGNVAQGGEQQVGVISLQNSRNVLGNRCVVCEVARRVEGDELALRRLRGVLRLG